VSDARAELGHRIEALEIAYEGMLGYAARGLTDHDGVRSGELRAQMRAAADALHGIVEVAGRIPHPGGEATTAAYEDLLAALDRDARTSRASLLLVLARTSVPSQLIDDLNASIHLRALLTDLFFLDELLKPEPSASD